MKRDKLFDIGEIADTVQEKLNTISSDLKGADRNIQDTNEDIRQLYEELGLEIPEIYDLSKADKIKELDIITENILPLKYKSKIELSSADTLMAIIAGAVSFLTDILLVGTPEIVKIYKGGENFDGSLLTKIIRNLGEGDNKFTDALQWFSEKCKVSYDISARKDIVYPDNHRLRSFSHDPFLGLVFSIFDICMNTATLIDNNGNIQILKNSKTYPESEKYFALLYFLGHIISDVFTTRGIQLPGATLTQLFTENGEKSVARIAENMYLNGYDLRHLASMSTPVIVEKLIIHGYIQLACDEKSQLMQTIAEKELTEIQKTARENKMMLISDAISCTGNVVKFYSPAIACNPNAINIAQWSQLIIDSIQNMKYVARDTSIEEVVYNRKIINENWERLLNN